MKWEILKGSEKDFEGAPDGILTIYQSDFGRAFKHGTSRALGLFGLISERRPITEPVVNQQLTTEWSGEGLPPVGCVCEFQAALGNWAAIRITAHGEDSMLMKQVGKDNEQYISKDNNFRPIRSPKDVDSDKAFSELEELEKAMPDGYQPYELLGAIVLAGYRKVE